MRRVNERVEPTLPFPAAPDPRSRPQADTQQQERSGPPARRHSPTDRVDAPLSPGDIISRAASMVPENRDPDSPKNRLWPAFEESEGANRAPETRENRPAQERRAAWRTHAWMRRGARLAAVGAVAGAVVGVPTHLALSGELRSVLRDVGDVARHWGTTARDQMRLAVDTVLVEGRQRTDPAALREALGVTRGADIMALDLDAVRTRVETLPWVARATVSRRLPDTLLVGLEERRAAARLRRDGRTILIGTDGTIIDAPAGRDHRALLLVAGEGAETHIADLFRMLAREPALRGRVRAAARMGERRWDIHFDTGLVLMLPPEHEVAAWTRFAEAAERYALLEKDAERVDMRLPDRMILRMREAPEATARSRRDKSG